MGQKYLWKLPDETIQGQAGKPFAHQPGSTLKFPCWEPQIKNACLCHYGATQYFAYYQYLSPQLQDIQDALVSDSLTGGWKVSSTKGHRWHSLGQPVYAGCFSSVYPQQIEWNPCYVLFKSGNNSSGNLLPTLSGKKPAYTYYTVNYPVRVRYVNTYTPCGGLFYTGTPVAAWESDSKPPLSLSVVSTGKELCGCLYSTKGYNVVSQLVTGVKKYSFVESHILRDKMGNPTLSAVAGFYKEIPDDIQDPSSKSSFCENFASSTRNSFYSARDDLAYSASRRLPWVQATYDTSLTAEAFYLHQDYSAQSVQWSNGSFSFFSVPEPYQRYKTIDVLAVGPSYGASLRYTVTKPNTSALVSALEQVSTYLDSSNIIDQYMQPSDSTVGKLFQKYPYLYPKGYGIDLYDRAYPPVLQDSDAVSPCNSPDLQGWAVNSNYSFYKYNIWQLNMAVASDSLIGSPYLKIPEAQLTFNKHASNLYQYQLFQSGWIVRNRFAAMRKDQPGKFFHPATTDKNFTTVQQLVSDITHNFTPDEDYLVYRNAWFSGTQQNGSNFYIASIAPTYMLQATDYDKSYYRELYFSLKPNPKYPYAQSNLYSNNKTAAVYLDNSLFLNSTGTGSTFISSQGELNLALSKKNDSVYYGDVPIQDRDLYVFTDRLYGWNPVQFPDKGVSNSTSWLNTWHDYFPYMYVDSVIRQVRSYPSGILSSGSTYPPVYIPDPNPVSQCSWPSIKMPATVRQWYRVRKYVPYCNGSQILFSNVPLTSQGSNSLLYAEYPATMHWCEYIYDAHSEQYSDYGTSVELSSVCSNRYIQAYAFTGVYTEDTLFNRQTDPVSSVYLHFSYNKPKTYGDDGLSNSLLFSAVSYRTSGYGESDSILLDYFFSGARSQALISAVSGTPCANCISFNTLYFSPTAVLSQARLGYTYIKFPASINYSNYYIHSYSSPYSQLSSRRDWHGTLQFASYEAETWGARTYYSGTIQYNASYYKSWYDGAADRWSTSQESYTDQYNDRRQISVRAPQLSKQLDGICLVTVIASHDAAAFTATSSVTGTASQFTSYITSLVGQSSGNVTFSAVSIGFTSGITITNKNA